MEKRNRILFVCMLVLSLVFVILYGGKLPYTMLYTSLLLPLTSIGYLLLVYVRFKNKKKAHNHEVTKGEADDNGNTILNEDVILYPYMSLSLMCSDNLFTQQTGEKRFCLPPRSSRTFVYRVECRYRGVYEIGINNVYMWDFLYLLCLKYTTHKEKSLIVVYPRIVPLHDFTITSNLSEDTTLDVRLSDAIENNIVSDIRGYTYGDQLNKIHWKLTARTGDIHVKHYRNTTDISSIVAIDLQRPTQLDARYTCIELEDRLIEVATGVIFYCLNNRKPIEVVYYDDVHRAHRAKEKDDFVLMHRLMAEIPFGDALPIGDVLNSYYSRHSEPTNLIVFSINLNANLYEALVRAYQLGYRVTLITIKVDTEVYTDILRALHENGVEAISVGLEGHV